MVPAPERRASQQGKGKYRASSTSAPGETGRTSGQRWSDAVGPARAPRSRKPPRLRKPASGRGHAPHSFGGLLIPGHLAPHWPTLAPRPSHLSPVLSTPYFMHLDCKRYSSVTRSRDESSRSTLGAGESPVGAWSVAPQLFLVQTLALPTRLRLRGARRPLLDPAPTSRLLCSPLMPEGLIPGHRLQQKPRRPAGRAERLFLVLLL